MPDAPAHNTDLAYAATLWKSADTLRGQIDAAEYKHVVLGLLFLQYISDRNTIETCLAFLRKRYAGAGSSAGARKVTPWGSGIA